MTSQNGQREPDMKVSQVAELLNLHPQTVRIMARQGKFPGAYKLSPAPSAQIRIPWAAVEDHRMLQPPMGDTPGTREHTPKAQPTKKSVPVGRRHARVKEAADFLTIHPETVRAKARAGEFPGAISVGRGTQIMIPWADIEEYAAEHQGEDEASSREVAEILDLHASTVARLVRAGAFPNAYKAGGAVASPIRIPMADVEDFRRRRPPVSR